MARYTVELRTIMSDSVAGPLLQDALATYPLYASANPNVADIIPTREVLNTKLLNHYKYREIGFETVGRFLDELQITMNEIMPYYNQMFHTVEIMAELPSPFDNVDVIEKYKETRTSTGKTMDSGTVSSSASDESETTSNVNSNSKNANSDMPQGNIAVNNIDSVTRAKEVNWTKNTSNDTASTSGRSSTETTNTGETNTEGSETVEHEYTKTGNQGVNTYAHDMNEFRTSIIDVTMQIIEDKRIAELFMMVY